MNLKSSDTLEVIRIQQTLQNGQQFRSNSFAEIWHLNAKVFIDLVKECLKPQDAVLDSKNFYQPADERHAHPACWTTCFFKSHGEKICVFGSLALMWYTLQPDLRHCKSHILVQFQLTQNVSCFPTESLNCIFNGRWQQIRKSLKSRWRPKARERSAGTLSLCCKGKTRWWFDWQNRFAVPCAWAFTKSRTTAAVTTASHVTPLAACGGLTCILFLKL